MGTMISLGVGILEIDWGKMEDMKTSVICFNLMIGKK